jgi:peptidoglycan/LPS O-acetylase OafA/YrhL
LDGVPVSVVDSALPPAEAADVVPMEGDGIGTRKRLDHIDAMRPVKQAGVVSTHALLAFAPVGTGLAVGAALMLLHVTREAFLFVSACMLTYSCRGLVIDNMRSFFRRRATLVALPYLCWTLIYWALTWSRVNGTTTAHLAHFPYLLATGFYQLYYLVVLMQFYVLFPLLLALLRRTTGHHAALLIVSGVVQALYVSLTHWGVAPHALQGFWASREIISYQFYLVAGMVVAVHLDRCHDWVCRHVALIVTTTICTAGVAELWYFLASRSSFSWLGLNSDPFQPIVIPFNIAMIASIYLIGVALVGEGRSPITRAAVQSGSDNSYGIFLAQMVFITILVNLGWKDLDHFVPWPLLCAASVALVFGLAMALTALLARTPWSRALTGRTRVPWTFGRARATLATE